MEPKPYSFGSISAVNANTFFTTKSVRVCALWFNVAKMLFVGMPKWTPRESIPQFSWGDGP